MNNKFRKFSIILMIFMLSNCSSRPDYKESLQKVIQKWDDAFKVANSTGRISLSQPVSRLLEIKREAEAVQIPSRMKDCYGHLLSYMDFTTESFLIFMQNEESAASFVIEKADNEFEKWQLCSLPEKEAKLLEERMKKAEEFSTSMCFGLGYGLGSFSFQYPQVPIDIFEMYKGLLLEDSKIMDALEEKWKDAGKEYMIPLVRSKVQRSCYPEYNNGYLFGYTGGSLDESKVPYKDLAGTFADTVKGAFSSTIIVSVPGKELQKQNQQNLSDDPLFVSGILDDDEPIAIIGGKTLRKGEMVDSYIINVIGNDYVEFLDRDGNVVRKELGK